MQGQTTTQELTHAWCQREANQVWFYGFRKNSIRGPLTGGGNNWSASSIWLTVELSAGISRTIFFLISCTIVAFNVCFFLLLKICYILIIFLSFKYHINGHNVILNALFNRLVTLKNVNTSLFCITQKGMHAQKLIRPLEFQNFI